MKVFSETKTPVVTQALVDYLEAKFPLGYFKSIKGVEELHKYQGKQEVIDHLKSLLLQ